MSRYDDPDSPEYREHNLGDDRMTADERAIERLEGKVARLTRELALQQAHERAQRATSESLAKELSAAHAKATLLEEALRERTGHKLDTDRQVFFYEQEFYVLSNFSAFCLYWAGRRFDTSEAAYQWSKFDHEFGSTSHMLADEVRNAIHAAPSAHEAFKLAERNKHLRRVDWDAVKVSIMRSILTAKAQQHEYVRRKLLETGDRELIEDSWRDDFWGWGPNRDGQNMLGKLWMEVRAALRGPGGSE